MSYLSLKDSERDAADDRPLSDYIAKANLLNDVGVANLLAHRDLLMKENEQLRDVLNVLKFHLAQHTIADQFNIAHEVLKGGGE